MSLSRSSLCAASALLALVSCRSLLDITPGRPLEDAAESGGKSSGGKTTTSQGGSDDDGGAPDQGSGGAPISSGGKGSAGTSKGGAPQAGSTSAGGAGLGGEAGSPPVSPFPEGACRDCIERNCATEQQVCVDDPSCAGGIDAWLSCTDPDASNCVSPDAGPLQDLEACAADSCDLCRHLEDGAPTVEILTPSNGAAFALDPSGLIEVSVRVHNVTLKTLGQCGTDVACGHVHLNLDDVNCRKTSFYNEWIIAADDQGYAEAVVDTQYCVNSIADRPLKLSASLSHHQTHADRMPLVQSSVTITLSQ